LYAKITLPRSTTYMMSLKVHSPRKLLEGL
jgi:hypothetical protein